MVLRNCGGTLPGGTAYGLGSGPDGLGARSDWDRRRWAQRADAIRCGKGGGAAVPLCDKKSHDGWLRMTIDLRVRRALENGACSFPAACGESAQSMAGVAHLRPAPAATSRSHAPH